MELKISPLELVDKLTFAGIEVESVTTMGEFLNSIVVGEILDKEKHPEADRLSICKVFDGVQTNIVVCGAQNCTQGQKIAFAPLGTEFPDFKLKKTKLRGIESMGMICSEKELGLSDNHEGIMVLSKDAIPGQSLAEYLRVSDTIYDVEITPNRPDLLGILGIARDLSAQLDIPLQEKSVSFLKTTTQHSDFAIDLVEPNLCTRYFAVRISGVFIQPSPPWLVEKLKIANIKPINNVVDITNYVMYLYGHPLHAFDAKKIAGQKIIIRKSRMGEVFKALDHITYRLSGEELVIADEEQPLALAGIIGGINSSITNETKDIILEAACFDPSLTRRTSYQLKILTDSSYRFERGMAEQTCEIIASQATELILKLAGGSMHEEAFDLYPNPHETTIVKLRPARIKKILALTLDNHRIINLLKNLGLKFLSADSGSLSFMIPSYRKDLMREIDLIEEIIRLYGMNNYPVPCQHPIITDQKSFISKRKLKNILVGNGFLEVVNISFTDPLYLNYLQLDEVDERKRVVRIQNPQGESFSILRSTLIPQLLINLANNINNGAESLKLFELNKVFTLRGERVVQENHRLTGVMYGKYFPLFWPEKSPTITFYDVKGLFETLIHYFQREGVEIINSHEPFYFPHSGIDFTYKGVFIGSMGKFDTLILEKFGIYSEVYLFDLDLEQLLSWETTPKLKFQEISKYPVVSRDISFIVEEKYLLADIYKTIFKVNPKLISKVNIFDQYTGNNIPAQMRSISLNITLCSDIKTLTEEQIKITMNRILEKLQQQFKIEMR